MLSKSDIIRHMEKVGDMVKEKYELVAVGGTCLTLQGIKSYTRDVDYIVERGDMLKFADAYKSFYDGVIHLAEPCTCFAIYMPSDYVSHTFNVGTFGNINLCMLSLADIVITKASRYNDRDKTDLESCVRYIDNVDNVISRLHDFDLGDDIKHARAAFLDIFGRKI